MAQSRKEMYEELIHLGLTPSETWEQIETFDFAEDHE